MNQKTMDILRKTRSISVDIGGEKIKVNVKPYLNGAECAAFAKDVVDSAKIDGVPTYSLFDYYFNANLLAYMTDIEIGESTDEISALIYGTDIIGEVCEAANDLFVANLRDACLEQYAEERRLFESFVKPDPLKKIADAVVGLADQMGHTIDSIDENTIHQFMEQIGGETANGKSNDM